MMLNERIRLFELGKSFETTLSITPDVIQKFTSISQDHNPLHHEDKFALEKGFPKRVAFGNVLGVMISRFVGMDLPTQDVMLIAQSTQYKKPFFESDEITLKGVISSVSEAVSFVEFKLRFRNQSNDLIATGSCSIKVI